MGDVEAVIEDVLAKRCEQQTVEVKSAHEGSPKVYDTLSSFSNQQDGGVIVFGIDERDNYRVVGVFDAQQLQKDIVEQGKEMTPEVRPAFDVCERDGAIIVVAHIASTPMSHRPVYRTTAGMTKGSYVRSGDQDLHMTPTELYEITAFKDGLRNDIDVPAVSDRSMLEADKVDSFVLRAKDDRPHMARRSVSEVLELTGATRGGTPTLAGLMALSDYPQQALPNLCVTAVAVAGTSMGQDESGSRFIDNKRLEGPIDEMIESTMAFVRRNTKTKVVVIDGKRRDIPEYPENAVREVVTNALMHRDYGPYNNGTPTRLVIYSNRLECWNPGGIYGGLSVDDLGYTNIQTRNPTLVSILEIQGVAENRHSGIPVIRDEMRRAGLRPPVFIDRGGTFTVRLFNEPEAVQQGHGASEGQGARKIEKSELLDFCSIPRSRAEIAEHFGAQVGYISHSYLNPMVRDGALVMTLPEKPRSKFQRFVAGR